MQNSIQITDRVDTGAVEHPYSLCMTNADASASTYVYCIWSLGEYIAYRTRSSRHNFTDLHWLAIYVPSPWPFVYCTAEPVSEELLNCAQVAHLICHEMH